MKRRRTFRGGYTFGKLAGSPRMVMEDAEFPSEVIIPLQQGFGEEVPPIVRIGDEVKAGQVIGIDHDSCSSPVHATVNGSVRDVRAIERLGQEVQAVVIESDGSRGWVRMEGASVDLDSGDTHEIGRMLYKSGVASLGRSGFPTPYNTSPIQRDDVDSLVINAVKCEPFTLFNEALLAGKVDRFVTGVDILRRALPDGVEVHIGIDDRDKGIIRELEAAADWIHVHPLRPKYPQDHHVVLLKTLLGREVPCGGSASDVRAVVMDVQSALHAYEAVIEGKPVMERIIALGGSGLEKNLLLRVRVGTPLQNILTPRMRRTESSGGILPHRCIYGGIMTGITCDDLSMPVDRTASSIAVLEESRDRQFLSFLRPGIDRGSFSNAFLSSLFPQVSRKSDTNMKGEHRPCVYCNYCEEVCPVGLMPYLLSKYITRDMVEEADRHRVLACIECGLCTYVCPSKIPLMTHIQEAKTTIGREDR